METRESSWPTPPTRCTCWGWPTAILKGCTRLVVNQERFPFSPILPFAFLPLIGYDVALLWLPLLASGACGRGTLPQLTPYLRAASLPLAGPPSPWRHSAAPLKACVHHIRGTGDATLMAVKSPLLLLFLIMAVVVVMVPPLETSPPYPWKQCHLQLFKNGGHIPLTTPPLPDHGSGSGDDSSPGD